MFTYCLWLFPSDQGRIEQLWQSPCGCKAKNTCSLVLYRKSADTWAWLGTSSQASVSWPYLLCHAGGFKIWNGKFLTHWQKLSVTVSNDSLSVTIPTGHSCLRFCQLVTCLCLTSVFSFFELWGQLSRTGTYNSVGLIHLWGRDKVHSRLLSGWQE